MLVRKSVSPAQAPLVAATQQGQQCWLLMLMRNTYTCYLQVCSARDLVIQKLLPIKSFMDHTMYDVGSL